MHVFDVHSVAHLHHAIAWFLQLSWLWRLVFAPPASGHDPSIVLVSGSGWFNSSRDNLEWLYPEDDSFANALAMFFKNEGAQSVADIGSGSGALTAAVAAYAHCSVLGLDGSPIVPPSKLFEGGGDVSFRRMDLAEPFPNNLGQFDWVMSIAVAEHIPVIVEHIFLSNLMHVAPHKGIVVVWGSRGMPGTGHVNCRDEAEVLQIFERLGFRHDVNASNSLRRRAVQPWNKLVLVLRRPSWPRGANKLDGLRSGFTVAFRGGAVMRANAAGGDLHLKPHLASRFDDGHLVWTREGRTRPEGDYRGVWVDGKTGDRVEVGCYTVREPGNPASFLGVVVDSCMDLRFLARLVQSQHDSVCWPSGPGGSKGFEWFSKERCCRGEVALPNGHVLNCFGEEFSPEACCIEVHDYPVDIDG